LYTPAQVAVSTALGGPLAGALLLALNERRLGRTRRALISAGSGFLGTAALVALGALLPTAAARGLAGASLFAMHHIAERLRTARPGGAEEAASSWWGVVGIGLLCLAAIVGVAVVIAVAFDWVPRD
jgi:hypothetical protein